MHKIIGVSEGTKEVIDTAETTEEAEYLVGEYRLAFGKGWNIYYV